MSLSLCRLFIRTIAYIGPFRLQRRLRYELRQLLDRRLPPKISAYLAGANALAPQWHHILSDLELHSLSISQATEPESVGFKFLQQERELTWPISWNDHWPRLWQFHLHYFDWARIA